jgi:GcrA cell cycle regulator
MIAKIMDITHNAVIGKANRLGLGPKPSIKLCNSEQKRSIKNSGKKRFNPRNIMRIEQFVPATIEAMPSLGRSILDISKYECRYATHEDEETGAYLFCGHGVSHGKPYCEAHCRVAYRPLNERMQEATKRLVLYLSSQRSKTTFRIRLHDFET